MKTFVIYKEIKNSNEIKTMKRKSNPIKKPTQKESKPKPGATPIYREDMPERAYRLALLGLTNMELAIAFGVHEYTINHWRTKHPEFDYAIYRARNDADSHVTKSLYEKACGYSHPEEKIHVTKDGDVLRIPTQKHYPPDTQAAIFILRNRHPEIWHETSRMELTGKDGQPIQCNHQHFNTADPNIDLSELSEEELRMWHAIQKKIQRQDNDEEEED